MKTKSKTKTKRGGGAFIDFRHFNGTQRDSRPIARMTKREQLAALAALQANRPKVPPKHDFGERRSTAAEREAARDNAKQIPPEIDFHDTGLAVPVRGRR